MADKVDLENKLTKLREEILSLEHSSACLRQENNNLSNDLNNLVQVIYNITLLSYLSNKG